MGIYNRDYYRDENSPSGPGAFGAGPGQWTMWHRILGLNILFFIIQILIPPFTDWFKLGAETAVLHGQIWRFLTYAFLHATEPEAIFHILFNMLLLFFYGRRLESMYGPREFALFYCASAIFSGMFFLLMEFYFRSNSSVIGASGAVIALAVLYALHFPREKVHLWGLVEVEMRWLAAGIILIDLFPVVSQILGNEPPKDLVAHTAHLGGALFAWIYFSRRLRISHWFKPLNLGNFRRSPTSNAKLKIYREEPEENLEEQVDRILQKIQDHGEASLSNRERETLQAASERYKNRQK